MLNSCRSLSAVSCLNLHAAKSILLSLSKDAFFCRTPGFVGRAELAGGVVDDTSAHGLFYLHSVRFHVFFSLDEDYWVGVSAL